MLTNKYAAIIITFSGIMQKKTISTGAFHIKIKWVVDLHVPQRMTTADMCWLLHHCQAVHNKVSYNILVIFTINCAVDLHGPLRMNSFHLQILIFVYITERKSIQCDSSHALRGPFAKTNIYKSSFIHAISLTLWGHKVRTQILNILTFYIYIT